MMKTIAILSLVTAMLGGCVVVPWGHGRGDGYYGGDGYYRGDRYYRGERYYRGDSYRGYSYQDRGR
jgi:hypothetical protein